jgi:flagellar basal-body rod protein FlgB
MKLFDTTKIPILNKALDTYVLRQKVTSSNIANINTVGYRAQTVTFDEELDSALKLGTPQLTTTNANHLHSAEQEAGQKSAKIVDAASIGEISNDPYASGVNNVDIDHEMTALAQNQLKFKYASRLIADTFRGIQKSIRGQA